MGIRALLQEKYKKQEEEYQQTKHMTTKEWLCWREAESEKIIRQMGYRRKIPGGLLHFSCIIPYIYSYCKERVNC